MTTPDFREWVSFKVRPAPPDHVNCQMLTHICPSRGLAQPREAWACREKYRTVVTLNLLSYDLLLMTSQISQSESCCLFTIDLSVNFQTLRWSWSREKGGFWRVRCPGSRSFRIFRVGCRI